MKKSYKKLSIALLCVVTLAKVQAEKDRSRRSENGVYVAKTPWPIAPIEDAVVGTAGVVTLDQTDADPSALAAVVPDAVPGVQYTRNTNLKKSDRKMKKNKDTKNKDTKKKKKKRRADRDSE